MPDGKMNVQLIRDRCSGYNCNSIQIIYDFKPGKRNGKYYEGTYREAFLPNNPEGQEILSLLKRSFDQKLTFTIGTSVTTGRDN
jgi:deltex-like protein